MDIKKIFERTKDIILRPKNEWFRIQAENMSNKQIIMEFALPYISIMAFAIFIAGCLYHDLTYAISSASITIVTQIIAIVFSSYILQRLQKNFGGSATQNTCYKTIVYALVPTWIITIIIAIAPGLSSISPLALYSFYLFFIGLDILIAVPKEKRIGFNLISILVMLLVYNLLLLAGNNILKTIIGSGNFTH